MIVYILFHFEFSDWFVNSTLKDVLHRGDRAMIYVFIAASYFPWLMLRPLPQDSWISELWWMVWLLALLGILYQQVFHERFKTLETCFYLFLGVAPSIAVITNVSMVSFLCSIRAFVWNGKQLIQLWYVLFLLGCTYLECILPSFLALFWLLMCFKWTSFWKTVYVQINLVETIMVHDTRNTSRSS